MTPDPNPEPYRIITDVLWQHLAVTRRPRSELIASRIVDELDAEGWRITRIPIRRVHEDQEPA